MRDQHPGALQLQNTSPCDEEACHLFDFTEKMGDFQVCIGGRLQYHSSLCQGVQGFHESTHQSQQSTELELTAAGYRAAGWPWSSHGPPWSGKVCPNLQSVGEHVPGWCSCHGFSLLSLGPLTILLMSVGFLVISVISYLMLAMCFFFSLVFLSQFHQFHHLVSSSIF